MEIHGEGGGAAPSPDAKNYIVPQRDDHTAAIPSIPALQPSSILSPSRPIEASAIPWPAPNSPPPPAQETTVVLSDRRVQLPSSGELPSLYSLCRQWVNNDPDFNSVPPPVLPEPPQLPPFHDVHSDTGLTDGSPPQPSDLPSIPGEGEIPLLEQLLHHNITHWKEVRMYDKERAALTYPKYEDRLRRAMNSLPG